MWPSKYTEAHTYIYMHGTASNLSQCQASFTGVIYCSLQAEGSADSDSLSHSEPLEAAVKHYQLVSAWTNKRLICLTKDLLYVSYKITTKKPQMLCI